MKHLICHTAFCQFEIVNKLIRNPLYDKQNVPNTQSRQFAKYAALKVGTKYTLHKVQSTSTMYIVRSTQSTKYKLQMYTNLQRNSRSYPSWRNIHSWYSCDPI